jgi:hypothetical protein
MTIADSRLPRKKTADLFPCKELLPGLVICEAIDGDPYSWGNATHQQPPFLVYLGYNSPQERDDYIAQLRHIWKIDTEITSRAAKRVMGYWYEIKIRGMRRYSDPAVFDLDYLSDSMDYGLDFLVHLVQSRLEAADYEAMMTSRVIAHC